MTKNLKHVARDAAGNIHFSRAKGEPPRPPLLRLFLGEELIVDSFAGGGGASSGVARAIGRAPDVAINHDAEAIAMHKANHPETRHYIEDVWAVDPVEACGGKPVGLAWFSPTCSHFSKAKGTALDESSIKIRGLAWVAVRWAAAVKPSIICLENVEEFAKWGPLHRVHTNGCTGKGTCRKDCRIHKPIKEREGTLFRAFVSRLEKLGYKVEWRLMRACDYGAPTTRRRLFLVARCDGRAISWPAPTHGPERAKPYRTAAECINWAIPCPSIFERDRPLADKTLARIARGIKKFVLENQRPFIVPVAYGGDARVNDIDEPLRTICGNRGGHAVVTPVVMKAKTYGGGGNDAKSVDEPLGTVTASKRGEHAVATATLVPTGAFVMPNNTNNVPKGVDEPAPTITTGNRNYLAVPYLVHRSNGERPEKVGKDGRVIKGQAPRIYDVEQPLGTIVAQGQKHAACVALLIKNNGGNNDRNGNMSGQVLDRPIDTIACRDQKSLTVASLVKMRGTSEAHVNASGHDLNEPMPTVTASGTHVAAVSAFLVRYNGQSEAQGVDKPAGTLTTKDRYSLVTVTIAGEEYVIADIGMRMLTPRELYRAQGFHDGYVIDPEYQGKPLTKTAQIRMVGNSVPPQMAEVIARAQLEAA